MTNVSRRYYERELGAGLDPSPGLDEHFGYTEPLRRFIQREGFEPQANEIPNTMPSWMPGDDYYTSFRVGDPYIKVDQGFARLPGAGYEALHSELDGVDPEDYPDINKLAILADVAPYSREYNTRSLRPAPHKNLAHARAKAACLRMHVFGLRARGPPLGVLMPVVATSPEGLRCTPRMPSFLCLSVLPHNKTSRGRGRRPPSLRAHVFVVGMCALSVAVFRSASPRCGRRVLCSRAWDWTMISWSSSVYGETRLLCLGRHGC